MSKKKTLSFLIVFLAVVPGVLTSVTPLLAASKEKVLYTFNGADGNGPYAGLIFDASGNLYGTTYSGGAYGYGTAFQVSPGVNGNWSETILHDFAFGADGVLPCAGLILDGKGNLYGTTKSGGVYGYGSVFQLSSGANGKWTEKLLHSFNNNDGLAPVAGLTFDAAGNLYGTTLYGGAYGYGTVFQLAPGADGTWTETVLYSFAGGGTDGASPYSGVVFDSAGNLYGTTFSGGAYGYGTVFEVKPGTHGTWSGKVLHSFGKGKNKDGINPYDGLVFDRAHKLYGTTYSGGAYGYGTIFELALGAKGKWGEKVLHSFNKGKGGAYPYGGVLFDSAGNMYGTTYSGGAYGYGTVFRFSLAKNGKWIEKVLSSFNGNDGNGPDDDLIADARGNLYGTTQYGGGSGCGGSGCGTVFEIVLRQAPTGSSLLHSRKPIRVVDRRVTFGSLTPDGKFP